MHDKILLITPRKRLKSKKKKKKSVGVIYVSLSLTYMFDVLHYKVTCEDREKFPAGFCPLTKPFYSQMKEKVQSTVGRRPRETQSKLQCFNLI